MASVIPERVVNDVDSERAHQLARGADGKVAGMVGWSFEFDDKNTMSDWVSFINIYLGRAIDTAASAKPAAERVAAFRKNMVKVAALAVAAVEAVDRNGEKFAVRHYDS